MENLLIYSGLSVMLLGTIFGLMAALKGFKLSKYNMNPFANKDSSVKLKIAKYTKPAIVFLILGFIVLLIGILLGLSS